MLPQGLQLRAPTSDDLGFVVKSYVRSYANSPWAGSMTRERQIEAVRGTLLDLIKRGVDVQVVCLESRPEFLLGFIASEQTDRGPVVHYVYVKQMYRQSGIGRGMVQSIASNAKISTSHRTPLGDYLFKPRQYDPRLARYGSPNSQRKPEGRVHD